MVMVLNMVMAMVLVIVIAFSWSKFLLNAGNRISKVTSYKQS